MIHKEDMDEFHSVDENFVNQVPEQRMVQGNRPSNCWHEIRDPDNDAYELSDILLLTATEVLNT